MQPQIAPTTSKTHLNQNPSTMYQEIQYMPQQSTQQNEPMINTNHTIIVSLLICLIQYVPYNQ
jgi:hypothetical protein